MAWFSDPQSWVALLTLTALEIVLGIYNIIFLFTGRNRSAIGPSALANTDQNGRTKRTGTDTLAGAQVVEHVRREIEAGRLGPGDRLPPERELALRMEVSRPSLRSGLRTLQAMGVVMVPRQRFSP